MSDTPTATPHDLRGALNAALLQLELAQRAQARQDTARLERSLAQGRLALERAIALVEVLHPPRDSEEAAS